MNFTLHKIPAVILAIQKSKSAFYLDISNGLFTKPVKIGNRSVAWPEHEINAINAARIAGKSEEEIRELVKELEAARKNGGLQHA